MDVPALVRAVGTGEHAEAYAIARASNPFASSCGHGCHAPCESACRRGAASGAPVAIGALEAFAAAFTTPTTAHPSGSCASPHDARSVAAARTEYGQRVAIIGGGAAGLACAHDLRLLGHRPVVLDAGHEPGGVLTRVIPDSRFPVSAARAECLAILSTAVEYRPGVKIDLDRGIDALFDQGFSAVFVAAGCWQRRTDDGLHAAHDALELLGGDHPLDGAVVVVGEGDLAVDAARELARRAAAAGLVQSTTLVLTRRAEEGAAAPHALAAAAQQGIAVHNGWLLAGIVTDRTGRTTGVEITRDGGSTRRIVPALHVVDAALREGAPASSGLERTAQGHLQADRETLRTSRPRVWAGGACAFGHRSIADAVADGKRAAWQMHATLTGQSVRTRLIAHWVEADDHDAARSDAALAASRTTLPGSDIPPADPFSSSAGPYTSRMAQEASRCYDCSVMPVVDEECTRCARCLAHCPTGAISLDPAAGLAVIDENLCTRCTACVAACPEGSITMARAVWEERLVFERTSQPPVPPERAYRPVRMLTPR